MNTASLKLLTERTIASLRSRVSFGRAELGQLEAIGVDSLASWVGDHISDSTMRGLAEDSARLGKVSFVGAKERLLLVSLTRESGTRIGVWQVSVAKDGDTYERQINAQVTARGSLKTIRSQIGKNGLAEFGDASRVATLSKTLKIDRRSAEIAGIALKSADKAEKSATKANAGKGAKNASAASKSGKVNKGKK